MPNAISQKNGSFPLSSSSNKIFSRTSSIFVSNRKTREAKEKAAQVEAQAQAQAQTGHHISSSSSTKTTAVGVSISPPIAEHSPRTPDPPIPGPADDTSKSPPESRSSDTSLPPTLIPTRTSSKSSKRTHRHSHSTHNIDLGNLRRSISLRSVSSPHNKHNREPSNTSTLALSISHENSPPPSLHSQSSSKPLVYIPAFAKRQKSADALSSLGGGFETYSPLDAARSNPAAKMMPMSAAYTKPSGVSTGRPVGASISSVNTSYSQSSNGLGSTMQVPPPVAGSQTPQMVYQHIMDTASKRISTLDYLRKAHEGRVYWFNTLLFTKPDLLKFSYFQPAKLARRATNYLLLGFSLPTILDLNSQTPTEYLKALNALLVEFEQYQQLHPPDGSVPSSLSRARVPQMFKRTTGKSRRQSSATDFSSNLGSTPEGAPSFLNNTSSSASSSSMMMNNNDNLLPQENYQHLLTPGLPFDPDFFETFATLCDVLIDCYTKVTQLIRGPEMCTGNVGELFGKADARVRKVIVAGVVREFEERCREGVKSEVAGVGKVVLGGLM